jgi:hypothetical protein
LSSLRPPAAFSDSLAALVNGNMFAGRFGKRLFVSGFPMSRRRRAPPSGPGPGVLGQTGEALSRHLVLGQSEAGNYAAALAFNADR